MEPKSMAENENMLTRASQDLQTIEDFVNLPADNDVYPRLLPSTNVGTLAGARQAIFEAGGLPATPFATKAKMEADGAILADDDLAMVYNETVNNGLYVKTAGVWVKSGYDPVVIASLNTAKLTDTRVKESESQFLLKSPNLFNAATTTVGKVIDATGNIVNPPSGQLYWVSDIIAVTPSAQYSISGEAGKVIFINIAYYDINKVFISRSVSGFTGGASNVVTIPSNVYYVRFNLNQIEPTQRQRMFSLGSVAPPYQTYYKEISGVALSSEIINSITSLLPDNDSAKDYIAASDNLFNHNTVVDDYLINSAGAVVPNTQTQYYGVSDFIAVTPSTQYTMSGEPNTSVFIHVAYFTADKVFIKRENGLSASPTSLTITIPSNAYYVRFNINGAKAQFRQRMFNAGSTALPFKFYGAKLTGITLADDVIEQINESLDIDTKVTDKFMLDIPSDGVFSTSKIWNDYGGFRSITAADTYAMYDTLAAAHPTYITKQLLGNDGLDNPIACYKFKPLQPSANVTTKQIKIFLTCGTHGFERVSALATYLMLEQMCNNWQSDPLLELLRFNVTFIVIPVTNPSGWNSFVRTNHNGVDINRNFPIGWTGSGIGTSTYGGPAPLSELESQYIKKVFDENKDISAFYDFHNFHGELAGQPYIWIPTSSGAYVQHMAQTLITRMTRKWRSEYTWIPPAPWFAGYTDNTGGAMIQDYALSLGIKFSATFEMCEKWYPKSNAVYYDALHCKTMTEGIANWMLININELSK